ncbi:uncharacterized protein RCC_05302 [Ramularia collo-cygni]|uniref:Uncharacterized protein n=1 Tax=Ramularia collo-cygni TaxID=112498 RepID=A0A2D3UT00_9PEZI|nr:uncharacterized protein RCC_05302 [Ramularia collo-cygni]CZT19451.1 uncharacterized protein RCC_05302 [Ramularia collo-cygni]
MFTLISSFYTTNGTYYIEPPTAAGEYCGETAVGPFDVTSGVCEKPGAYSVSILPLADRSCTYTVFHGTQHCTNASSKQVYKLPRGGKQVCATLGIYNPSERHYNSGLLECLDDVLYW